ISWMSVRVWPTFLEIRKQTTNHRIHIAPIYRSVMGNVITTISSVFVVSSQSAIYLPSVSEWGSRTFIYRYHDRVSNCYTDGTESCNHPAAITYILMCQSLTPCQCRTRHIPERK